MQRTAILAIGLLALLLCTGAGKLARQIQFGQWGAGSDIVFDYRLADFAGVERRIGFRLAKSEIDEARNAIQAFSNADMAAAVEARLRQYMKREAPDVAPTFQRKGNSVHVSLEGSTDARLQQVMAALDEVYRRGEEEYLRRLFMRDVAHTIYLDYPRLAQHYTKALRPLADAIAGVGGDERARLSLALAFFQTIPYDALTDHDVSNGVDFIAPPVLLNLNRGDCDSKAVALGAVLHSLLPNRKLIIVILPRHAVVGIDLPAQGNERTLKFEGRTYVLMETAGPAPFEIGALFPNSDAHIKARRIELILPL